MTTTKIQLTNFADVQNFVNTITKFAFDIDLVSGRYIVDAKSIMGIYSLDLNQPIELRAHTEDAEELFAQIEKYIAK
ncbi:MAG: HPr family phosphocarrier protein [Oscillospiraceae bacterium]|nr:HPr family phosphocarrier protein [Oscillospiraceae bacterium]MBR7084130.1 HPr family phosphocarrier protein [Oscillospiraceae bacterium]